MRTEHPPLCGRDHLSFRSYYYPVKVGDSGFASCFVNHSIRPQHHLHFEITQLGSQLESRGKASAVRLRSLRKLVMMESALSILAVINNCFTALVVFCHCRM